MAHLTKISSVSWPTLFRAWEKCEASQTGWQRHYRERGFASWREWRTAAYRRLKPTTRKWIVYKVDHPELVVPTWFGGPFRGWRKHYQGSAVTFKTLALRQSIRHHGKVLSIMKNFPRMTQLLGVVWKGRIVVIEGMHRACAVALSAKQGKKLKTSMTIALTTLSGKPPNLSSGRKI